MSSELDIAEAFESVEKMLWRLVDEFKYAYGIRIDNTEDLFSVSSLFFVKAYHSYDSRSRAKFSTWVWLKAWRGLQSHIRYEARKTAHTTQEEEEGLEGACKCNSTFNLTEFFEVLSEEAEFVAELVVHTSPGLARAMRDDNAYCSRHAMRRGLQDYLQGRGWEKDEIEDAFEEISEVLYH
jgi:hypothetical protein